MQPTLFDKAAHFLNEIFYSSNIVDDVIGYGIGGVTGVISFFGTYNWLISDLNKVIIAAVSGFVAAFFGKIATHILFPKIEEYLKKWAE